MVAISRPNDGDISAKTAKFLLFFAPITPRKPLLDLENPLKYQKNEQKRPKNHRFALKTPRFFYKNTSFFPKKRQKKNTFSLSFAIFLLDFFTYLAQNENLLQYTDNTHCLLLKCKTTSKITKVGSLFC